MNQATIDRQGEALNSIPAPPPQFVYCNKCHHGFTLPNSTDATPATCPKCGIVGGFSRQPPMPVNTITTPDLQKSHAPLLDERPTQGSIALTRGYLPRIGIVGSLVVVIVLVVQARYGDSSTEVVIDESQALVANLKEDADSLKTEVQALQSILGIQKTDNQQLSLTIQKLELEIESLEAETAL